MSGAAELLASSGGLDFERFQKRPAALQKEPASASQQCLKPPSWSSECASSIEAIERRRHGRSCAELKKLVVVAL